MSILIRIFRRISFLLGSKFRSHNTSHIDPIECLGPQDKVVTHIPTPKPVSLSQCFGP